MAGKQGRTKKARKTKTSAGSGRGARRQRPPELLLISMGKGMAHTAKIRRR